MATGFEFNNTCFATVADATDAYYLNQPQLVAGPGQTGGSGSITGYAQVTGAWKFQQYTFSAAGVYTLKFSVAPPTTPTFASCTVQSPTFSDVFSVPLASDLQSVWMTAFAPIMIVFLSAWAFQQIQGFVDSKWH